MRIVALADTHTFQDELPPIPDGDLFIHAGDLLRGGTLAELEPVTKWLTALPHPHKIVVAGSEMLGPGITTWRIPASPSMAFASGGAPGNPSTTTGPSIFREARLWPRNGT